MRYVAAGLLLVSLALCVAPVHARSRKEKQELQQDRDHIDHFTYEDWHRRRHLHGDYEAVRKDLAEQLFNHGVRVDWRDYDVTTLSNMLTKARQPGLYPEK